MIPLPTQEKQEVVIPPMISAFRITQDMRDRKREAIEQSEQGLYPTAVLEGDVDNIIPRIEEQYERDNGEKMTPQMLTYLIYNYGGYW